jgi:two-component system, OmpR family, sensor histidine kinase SaeS
MSVRPWRPIALLLVPAAAGALGTLLAAAAAGMHIDDLRHIVWLIIPALLSTIAAIWAVRLLLPRLSVRQGIATVSFVGAAVALANLAVLSAVMFVDGHDATVVAVFLVYSAGAGVGAALALARAQTRAIDRLSATAGRLATGDLGARVGPLEAGTDLDELARVMDEMAGRLAHSTAHERELEARRRDLVTAVSHDLRTPLARLRAMTEAIDDRVVEDTETFRRYAAEMRRSVDQLVGLVDDLFELAQVEVGAIEAETERARVVDVVRSAVAAVQPQADDKRLAVESILNGAGEARCSPHMVRVLQTLLSNAVRHTPADGTIRIEAGHSDVGLEMCVEDTGEGIAASDIPRIFDPFYRADPARSGPGSGLGLTLARRMVEAMGGRIEAANRTPCGARFSVTLPASATACAASDSP